jgi:acyl-coenzyme A synthetase/AMP-(fatty) acid ligase
MLDPPYLCLSVSQATLLPQPSAPEPVDHGNFSSLLDHRAQHQASQVAVGFTQGTGKQCVTFTFQQLAQLSQSLAHHIKPVLLQSHSNVNSQPVVAILGPSGPDFLLHVLACWKLGAAILPIALGTPSKGVASLIEKCGASLLLYAGSQKDTKKEILDCLGHADVASLEWQQDTQKAAVAKEDTTLEAVYPPSPLNTLVIFQSSGSSGTPKPLAQLHKFWSTSLLTAQGREHAAYTTTPLFHGGLSDFFRSVQASAPIYFFPWYLSLAPTTANILESIRGCPEDIKYFLSVPFILEMLFKDKEACSLLQAMHLVSTGGAPLSQSVGDEAVKDQHIKLVSRLGSSECGFLMSSFRDFEVDKEWSWLRIPDELGQSLLLFEGQKEQAGQDLFELVVSSKWPSKQLSNRANGSFATGDLYERHPQHSNRWRYKRRADDTIVMVNGKKVTGSLIESALCASPLIKDAIVFGSNRPLLGAVVFLSENNELSSTASTRSQLKTYLASINGSLPSHGRIPVEMIHIGDDALYQSLPRSSKGTIQKGLASEKMQSLINDVYHQFSEGTAPSSEERKSLKGDKLVQWLKQTVEEVLDSSIGLDDDFYQSGMDSIMAARTRAAIHQSLLLDDFKLQSSDIYKHSTVNLLGAFIDGRGKVGNEEREKVMQDMVKRYTTFSKAKAKDDSQVATGTTTILLTGATGALGSQILFALTQDSEVDHVICLVRAKDNLAAKDRVRGALQGRGLQTADKKIICVTNLWELGLRKEVTRAARFSIIHVSVA